MTSQNLDQILEISNIYQNILYVHSICRGSSSSFEFIFPFYDGGVFFVNADKKESSVQLVANEILDPLAESTFSLTKKKLEGFKMPDESCRKCGKHLYAHTKCTGCQVILQDICLNCGRITFSRYHTCSPEITTVALC